MTALVLAQKRIATVMPAFEFVPTLSRILDRFTIGTFLASFAKKFHSANRNGLVSAILLGLVLLSMAIYLVALFYSFSLGFQIQSSLKTEHDLMEALQGKEVLFQEKINLLTTREGSILKSMEKVSVIKYLTGKGLAINIK